MKIYTPKDEHITVTAKNMVKMAAESNEPVFAVFNQSGLVANPWTTKNEIMEQ